MIASLFGVLAVITLLLAIVGVYALTAHGVAQRTHDIGIRLAFGATERQVVWLLLRRTVVQLVLGVALGLAGAVAVGGAFGSVFPEVRDRDPLTILGVVASLVAVGVLATVLPARRAVRLDPVGALRYE